MFVFIDEAGHTGKDSKSVDQPVFTYLATISKKNLDLDLDGKFVELLEENNFDELHGSKCFYRLESFASEFLSILHKNTVHFFYSVVEKDFMVYAKLYDILFDNIENKGARFQAYQIRDLRMLLLSNLMKFIPVEVAHWFYEECLLANKEEDAIAVFKQTCEIILQRLSFVGDPRTKEIIVDAVGWAYHHPTAFTVYHAKKETRWTHLPHVVGFLPLLSQLSLYAKKHKQPILKITHDDQMQLKKTLNHIHKVAADPTTLQLIDLKDNGVIDLTHIKKTEFEMRDSRKSYGLQISDLCLYIMTHKSYLEEYKYDKPKSYDVLKYIDEHSSVHILSRELHEKATKSLYRQIMDHPFSDEELEQGKLIVSLLEKKFQDSIC